MAPSHEKGRRGTRVGDDEFVLYLQGVPAHCRWQELKDFVRQTAQHIRQAVVYDDPHGFPTGIGQIIVKNEDEAWRTFRKLAANGWNGQVLTVTLAKANAPTEPIAGPKQSPSASLPRITFGGSVTSDSVATAAYLPPLMSYVQAYPASTPSWTANPEAHPFSPSPAVFPFGQVDYQYYPMNPPPQTPAAQHFMFGAATMDPTMFVQTMPYYYQGADYPEMITSTTFTLAPSRNNNSSSSSRSVIIDNLHPNVDVQTLKAHFRTTAGAAVERCEIVVVPSDGNAPPSPHHGAKDKACYAMATFSSADEATRAVSLCNGTLLVGNRIVVRFDRDCTNAIFPPGGGGGGGEGLQADEDWVSTTPLSSSSSYFQPSSSSPTFSGEGWNLLHSTVTTSSNSPSFSSSSSSPTASSSSVLASTSHTNPTTTTTTSPLSSPSNNTSQSATKHSSSSDRPRRDSGKELIGQDDAKRTDSGTCTSSAKQPLVVNGSMSGRAKM
ncbi:RNA binding protein [Talaromyces islandicus]|uniref:RNA binding protein n=1 Tax=Talaromyces islandicus TaxID=28573 RepID=A0A0U1LV41_TALIS|nr:RNA binding protein [Talaromyces islandicus]